MFYVFTIKFIDTVTFVARFTIIFINIKEVLLDTIKTKDHLTNLISISILMDLPCIRFPGMIFARQTSFAIRQRASRVWSSTEKPSIS